jgi:hypothetical protein
VVPPLTREEALRELDLPAGSDPDAVKRAYRRLAREHHPDRGGSTETFHRLQVAYERLVDDPAPVPRVARGRPSRPFAVPDTPASADVSSVDWTAAPARPAARLDRDAAAVWLATVADLPPAPVRPLIATSRGPGSRLNGVAIHLASGFTSRLTVDGDVDDRGRAVVAIELAASTRRARRALDRVPLDGWVRRRGSSSTRLRATLPPSADPRETAVRALDRVEAMLGSLEWPLSAWTATDARR